MERSSRRHRIGRARALHVIRACAGGLTTARGGGPAIAWLGQDDRGLELEVLATVDDEEIHDLPAQDQLVEEVLESVGRPLPDRLRGGRPSVHGGSGASPHVAFRLSPEVRRRAEAEASRRGVSISQLAREALEHGLA